MVWNTVDENIIFDGTPRLTGSTHLSSYLQKAPVSYNPQYSQQKELWDILKKLSQKDLIKHTQNITLEQKRAYRQLFLYIDLSPWLYNFRMNSMAILTEWNYICRQCHPEYIVSKIEFRLSNIARKNGETGIVSNVSYNKKYPIRELSSEEIQYIDDITSCIKDDKLRKKTREVIKYSLMSKSMNN